MGGHRDLGPQLAAAQQITHIGSYEWDAATGEVTWSDELYRIYGMAPRSRAITFDYFLSRLHPDDRELILRNIGEAMARGGRFHYQERIFRADGELRVLDTVGEVKQGPDGRACGLIGTCRDVTDDQRRDRMIELYRNVFSAVRVGLVVWRVDNPDEPERAVLVAINPTGQEIAGGQTRVGGTFRENFMYAVGGPIPALIGEVARSREVRELDEWVNRQHRVLTFKGFPLPEGQVGLSIIDVTDRVRARQLQAAEQEILEMILSVAPLDAVLGRLARLIEEQAPPGSVSITVGAAPGEVATRILAGDGRLLGHLALRHPTGHPQTAEENALLARASHLAALAIERRELDEQLRGLSARVEAAREDERNGIAHEIHEELAQELAVLKMDLAWLGRDTDSEVVLTRAIQMGRRIDGLIDRVRRLFVDLRSGELDHLGLVAAVEWQCTEFEKRSGVACVVRDRLGPVQIPRGVASAVFRITQEALSNVARHAGADRVEVRLDRAGDTLHLAVHDDGKGITVDEASSPRALGLLGIKERARALGGTASIGPATPRGTLVMVDLPIEERP